MVIHRVIGICLLVELLGSLDKAFAAKQRRKARKQIQREVKGARRKIAVVSTAAMPWMTGTAVNPTLRAAFLDALTDHEVTLVVPWLALADQELVFPNNQSFEQPTQQERCIREWVQKRTGLSAEFRIAWYAGRYDKLLLGIFPVGSPMDVIAADTDFVVLEEPEHINWFHCGLQWTEKFHRVVGVIHTNQVELGRRNAGLVMAIAAWLLTYMLSGMHCHKVIKLSDTIQLLPRQATGFVHAAAPMFLEEGTRKAKAQNGESPFSKGAYALGKVVWGKGWEELMKLLEYCKRTENACPATAIDCYGDGEAKKKIEAASVKKGLPMKFHAKRDHLDKELQDYKVFVNASTSDVVATTSIEALAMGKWLVCADHPCNHFAAAFPNTLVYHNPDEFCRHLEYALEHDPHPLDQETLRQLGWEAATERFLDVAEIGNHEWPSLATELLASSLWRVYRTFTSIEPFRQLVCAGRHTKHSPKKVTDYDPTRRRRKSATLSVLQILTKLVGTISFAGPGWVIKSESSSPVALLLSEKIL